MMRKFITVPALLAGVALTLAACGGGGGGGESTVSKDIENIELGGGQYSGHYTIRSDEQRSVFCENGYHVYEDAPTNEDEIILSHEGNDLQLVTQDEALLEIKGAISGGQFNMTSNVPEGSHGFVWMRGSIYDGKLEGRTTVGTDRDSVYCEVSFDFYGNKLVSEADINEAPLPAGDALLQGYVSQTRVSGATVWIDKSDNNENYNNSLDFGETSGITSTNGLFSLTLDSLELATDYRIVSLGGTARSISDSSESIGVMIAPRGAKNITPLTTMVALNSELANKIDQPLLSISTQSYSELYDVDIAKSGGTYGEYLMLAKGIEVYMYFLGRTNEVYPLIDSTQGHVDALRILADNLNKLDHSQIFTRNDIASKIQLSVSESLKNSDSLSRVMTSTEIESFASSVGNAASDVMRVITTGTGTKMTEESILNDVSNAFTMSEAYIKTNN